jgi:hypothetical protein
MRSICLLVAVPLVDILVIPFIELNTMQHKNKKIIQTSD